MNEPKLINIDGPNGVGKSTVSTMVHDMLRDISNIHAFQIHFHRRDTALGELIQQVLDGAVKIDSIALQMLYTADRVDFTNVLYQKICETPTKLILVDRYSTSGMVYSQLAGIEINEILENERKVVHPLVSFILDAPTETLINRLKVANPIEYGDIFEGKDKIDKVNSLYANLNGKGVIHIDATRPADSVASEIYFIIKVLLSGGENTWFRHF